MAEIEKKTKTSGLFRRMQADDVDYVTDIRTSILAQSPRGGRMILWATMLLFVIFIIWAAVSEVEQVTRGQGKVIPASQIQAADDFQGGEIKVLPGFLADNATFLGFATCEFIEVRAAGATATLKLKA